MSKKYNKESKNTRGNKPGNTQLTLKMGKKTEICR